MRLFSYIVARDYGFAPNPFHGICTLATCKPRIRSSAEIGDWIVGTGAKGKYNFSGRLIYAMQVTEILDFDTYWNDPRFLAKQPVLNGSLKQLYGDNIYHRRRGRWIQADSHHSLVGGQPNPRNIARDTSADRVLVSSRFVYFGAAAPIVPKWLRLFGADGKDLCAVSQGHRVHAEEFARAVEAWLGRRDKWGLQGLPLEFANHTRQRRHAARASGGKGRQ